MSIHRFLPLLFLPLFALPACDEDDGGDDGAMETDGAGDDADEPDPSGGDDSDEPDPSGGDDSGANTCEGGWSLGSVPFVGDTFIGQCDDSPPRTCLTGTYIVFDDGDCWCLPECSQAGPSEGDACTDDGSVTCTRIENAQGTSNGVFCVPPEWGLCG